MKKNYSLLIQALMALSLLFVTGCSKDDPSNDSGNGNNKITVTGVTLNKTTLTLDVGKTDTLKATVTPSDATNKNVTWTSDNAKVATVTGSGIVTAIAAGTTTVTVTTTDGNKTATCFVSVNAPVANQPPTCSITSPQNNAQFNLDESISVAVVAEDKDGTIAEVQLYVDNVGYSAKTVFPYNFTINAVVLSPGAHTLRAVAKDNQGAQGESSVSITVKNATTPVADPEGTITLLVRNYSNGSTQIPVYNYSFGIDNGNNFYSMNNVFLFASVGAVSGLGNVTKIPDSGWTTTLAVTPGNGYVAACWDRYPNNSVSRITFARIYVDSWTTAAGSGGIIGAEIKYQYPFNGTATSIGLSQNSVNLVNYTSSPFSLNKISCAISSIQNSNDGAYPAYHGYYGGKFTFDGSIVKIEIDYTRGTGDWGAVGSPNFRVPDLEEIKMSPF